MLSLAQNLIFGHSRLLATFHGHTGPISSLAISHDGKYLASGGADGLKIWDTAKLKEIAISRQSFQERNLVLCVCWLTQRNETLNVICCGNALGYLVFFQYRPSENQFESILTVRIARGEEILCITADPLPHNESTIRLAISTRDKCIQVWTFDSKACQLVPVFSKIYSGAKDIVPKALAFDSNPERDLYVFGLYDGGLYKYGGNNAQLLSGYQLASQIGHASVDINRRICVVDNADSGFDLYKLDTGSFVKNFTTKKPQKTYPRCVVFADMSRLIVGGSDYRQVYIFDRKSGRTLDRLKHARKGGVEIIATHDIHENYILVATASSTVLSGPNPILLWDLKSTGRHEEAGVNGRAIWDAFRNFVKYLVVLAAVAFLAESYKPTVIASVGQRVFRIRATSSEIKLEAPNPEGIRLY